MKSWRKIGSGSRYDIVQYTKKIISEYQDFDLRIYLGTDSQVLKKSRVIGYVSCIAFHIGSEDKDGTFHGKGVHVLYKPYKIPNKLKDIFSRLYKETELTLEISEDLRSRGILVYQIDLDFNQDEEFESNRCNKASAGLFSGLGYRVASKPDELFATCAADQIIKKVNWSRVTLSDI